MTMPLLLRSTYLSVFTCTIIFAVYGWWVFQVLGVAYFTGPDELQRIGKAIGILILAGYAFEIVVQLSVVLIGSRFKGSAFNEFIVDERDKLIEYKSIYFSSQAVCFGIFASIFALAIGWAPFWVFNILVLFYAVALTIELGTKIFLYKRSD